MRTLTNEEMSEVAGGWFFRRSRCSGSYRTRTYSWGGCNPKPECEPEPEPPKCEPEPEPPACGNPPIDDTPAEPPVLID
jgi:hypothetical protein